MLRRDFLRLGALPLSHPGGEPGRSCIVLHLTGGASQLDTWDMKPDAPSDVRGPFRVIRTNVPGMEISEIFPRMARHADKFALVRSVHDASVTTHEPATDALPDAPFDENCRRALEMVAAGARFVRVNMFATVYGERTWDAHGWKPFSSFACYRDYVGPLFDRAFSTLLQDLYDRGLLGTTLVVATGEFGRAPRINPSGGRDHWPHCRTVVMAGGGVRGGQVWGSSDRMGAEPRDNPVTAAEIEATVRRSMGLAALPGVLSIEQLFI